MYLSIKNFYKVITPTTIRKISDSISAALVATGTTMVLVGHETISMFIYFMSFLSHFFSNVFCEGEKIDQSK